MTFRCKLMNYIHSCLNNLKKCLIRPLTSSQIWSSNFNKNLMKLNKLQINSLFLTQSSLRIQSWRVCNRWFLTLRTTARFSIRLMNLDLKLFVWIMEETKIDSSKIRGQNRISERWGWNWISWTSKWIVIKIKFLS